MSKNPAAVQRGREALEAVFNAAKKASPDDPVHARQADMEVYFMHFLEKNPQTRILSPAVPKMGLPINIVIGVDKQTPETKRDIAAYLHEKYQPHIKTLSDQEYRAERMDACRQEIAHAGTKVDGLYQLLLCAETGPLADAPEYGAHMRKYPNGAKMNYVMTDSYRDFVKPDGTLNPHGRDMLDHLQETRGQHSVNVGADGMITGLSKKDAAAPKKEPRPG